MSNGTLTHEQLRGDALLILKTVRDNARSGKSTRLADVKSSLEASVTLDFDTYFFFLRKYQCIAMDREANLKLTDAGDRAVAAGGEGSMSDDLADFFADQLAPVRGATDGPTMVTDDTFTRPPPPPPPSVDAPEPVAPPPPVQTRTSSFHFPPPPPPPAPPSTVTSTPMVAPTSNLPAADKTLTARPADADARYVKHDPIGSGPLGTVFKGKHAALGTDVCIKELKDIFGYFSFLQRGEVIKRLKKELCHQAQVQHPGVLRVFDQSTDVARPYFVTELLKTSLREKLDQAGGKPLPIDMSMRLFLQLAYALRAAHEAGLTHHNLKPENILFDGHGNARISDFGLSRVIEVDTSKGMPQVFVGTGGMAYMAPELISRSKDAGPSADVYALGIVLFEMLTGQIPGRRSPLPSEVNDECPSKVDPIFDKMTHDRKDARYPDMDAMLDDFYAAFSDSEYLKKGDLILES